MSSIQPTSKEIAEQIGQLSNLPTSFNREAADRLDSAISKLIAFKPVFGIVFIYLNKRQNRQVPTMGVGIIRRTDMALYYNPEWILGLTTVELRAVLQHEALHVLLHHIVRADHFSLNKMGFNITADMAINCHLTGLPGNCFYPSTFKLPDFESAEWYYEKLKQEANQNGQESVAGYADGKGNMVDDHSGWDECEEDVVKEKIKAIADKCIKAQEQKGWSEIGTNLAQAIIEANKATVNWKREVRWFINKLILAGHVSTRSRINRQEQAMIKHRKDDFLKNVYIKPGTKRDFRARLLVALDTSGSVSDLELQQFIGEINGMINHVDCDVIMFDTSICCEPMRIKKKLSNLKIYGRGGTNFDAPVRFAEEHGYDGLIIMSDGMCPFPEAPRNCRVLWAFTPPGHGIVPPYGKFVPIELRAK